MLKHQAKHYRQLLNTDIFYVHTGETVYVYSKIESLCINDLFYTTFKAMVTCFNLNLKGPLHVWQLLWWLRIDTQHCNKIKLLSKNCLQRLEDLKVHL